MRGNALRGNQSGALHVPFFAKSNGDWIRSTPALDADRLYVAGMRDVLVCLDARDGKEIWRKDFVEELGAPLPDFGFVCSPLVDGEAVYAQAGASFVKLNKRTGDILWRTLKDQGGMWGSVFSSPIIATLGGQRQLVVQTRQKLAGVNPADGEVLWEQPVQAFRGMNILTPVILGDTLFTSTYGGRTIGFKVAQGNRILALDQRGRLFLLLANKERHEELDSRKLTDAETWAHLAVADDQLFVRELNALTAFRWRADTALVK